MRFLIDTNVLSEPGRPKPDARVVTWLDRQSSLDLAISVLTLGEIEKGIQLLPPGRKRERLAEWLATDLPRQFHGRVLPVDDRVALAWGGLLAEARRAHRPVPVTDSLLLATAEVYGLILVTRNERDCGGRGVPIHNPWET
jgi:toxin FitB